MSGTMQKTILLVEDEVFIAMLEKQQLVDEGYRVITASSGLQAINIILSGVDRVDIILMDIDLGSGIDGTETAVEILKTHDIPIVFVSSHTEKEIVRKTENITSYGYVVKNSGIIVLDASIKMAFRLFEAKTRENEKNIALRESEERFRSIVENIPIGMFQSATDGRLLYVNSSFAHMFGYENPDELMDIVKNRSSAEVFYEYPSLWPEYLKQVESNNGNWSVFENRYRDRDGKIITGILSFCERLDPVTGRNILYGFVQDITEKKRNLVRLKESRNFLLSIIDQSPLPTWVSDNKGNLIKINRACCELFHITEEDVTGKYNIFFDNIVISQGYLPLVKKVFEEGQTVNFILNYDSSELNLFKLSDTVSVILDVTISPLLNSKGVITNAVIQHKDITERIKNEAALLLSEQRFMLSLKSAPVIIAAFDTDLKLLWIYNNRTPESKDIAGKSNCDLFPENESAAINRIYRMVIESGVEQNEKIWLTWCGKRLYFDLYVEPTRDLKGVITGVCIAAVNLTQLKIVEESLKASEQHFRMLSEYMPFIICTFLPDSTILYANHELSVITGLSKDELTGQKFFDLIDRDEGARIKSGLESLTPENPAESHEQIHVLNDGTKLYFKWRNRAFFDEEGKVLKFTGVAVDITAFKQTEEKLQDALLALDTAQEIADIGFCSLEIADMAFKWSDGMKSIFGIIKDSDIPSFYEFLNYVYPDDRDYVKEQVIALISPQGETHIGFMYRIISAGREIKYIEHTAHKVFDNDGKLVRVLGSVHDITERTLSEMELKKSEEMLSLTQNAAGAGLWHWNILTGKISWSPLLFELLGIDQVKQEASFEIWRSILHPDDIEPVEASILRAVESHENISSEFRIIRPDDSVLWLNSLGKCYYDELGNPVWMSGICFDITQRKTVEHVLRDSETRYRELFNNISCGVAIYEAVDNGNDFIFRDFNKAAERIDGDRREDLIGKSILDVRPGIRQFGLFNVLRRVWETGTPEHFPLNYYSDNRISGWYDNYIYRLPSYEIVAVFDIIIMQKDNDGKPRTFESHFRTHGDPV